MRIRGLETNREAFSCFPIAFSVHKDREELREQCDAPGCVKPSHCLMVFLVQGHALFVELCQKDARIGWEMFPIKGGEHLAP